VFCEPFSWALLTGSGFVKKTISLKTIFVREEEENKEWRVSGETLIVCGEEATKNDRFKFILFPFLAEPLILFFYLQHYKQQKYFYPFLLFTA
jgi:hypothetical protein